MGGGAVGGVVAGAGQRAGEERTIITTEANAVLAPVHHRMPVFLDEQGVHAWMAPGTPPDMLLSLLRPPPEERLRRYDVSTRVNSPRNGAAELVRSVA